MSQINYPVENLSNEQTTSANTSPLAGLGINAPLFFSQLINFAIVAAVIWFLILKPLTKKMSERQKMIDESIDNAKKIQDNLSKSEKDYQTRIDKAKVEANKIMEKAVAEAEEAAEATKEAAKKDIEKLVNQARKNLQEEKNSIKDEIKKESANFVILALERILEEKIDSAKDKKIIENVLRDLK
jgi:F-type H+-transporting ATPase subunit b